VKLDFFNNPLIPDDKLLDYCLNPLHPDGKHKARVFKSILNIDQTNFKILKSAIIRKIKNVDVNLLEQNEFGSLYFADMKITNDQLSAVVRTCWIIKIDESFPRLTSCFVIK
jgi:hypothetical protein